MLIGAEDDEKDFIIDFGDESVQPAEVVKGSGRGFDFDADDRSIEER